MRNNITQAIMQYLDTDSFGEASEEQQHEFIERTKKHIDRVNKYGAKIGREFPLHDASKLTTLLSGYGFYNVPKDELTKEEELALDAATLLHITQSPHHPEYWTETDLTGFTRTNTNPHGIIDATEMPEDYLEEMVCDWAAMGEEFGNSALDWFNKVNGVRWAFTDKQQKFIKDTIEKVEG